MNGKRSLVPDRLREFLRSLTAPHASIREIGLVRRARLLNILTLIEALGFAAALTQSPRSSLVFWFLFLVAVVSYGLGRWKYPEAGALIFSIGLVSTAFLSLFGGFGASFMTTTLALVPIALIVASGLTSQNVFAALVIYATAGTALAPYYSNAPLQSTDVMAAGGIVFFSGAILFGILVFRADLERSRLEEIRAVNQELQQARAGLEDRVEERTRSLAEANRQIEERAGRLQTISEISHEISEGVDQQTGELLSRITRIISGKLGFYHVGIFLLDEEKEYAVLRAANSQGGQRMLDRRHQLKVGGTGIVGYVSQSGRPRIALDTGTDAVFFNNPDLPDTRSEIALPLKFGTTVLGVLDVQSTASAAFTDEDVNTLGTLSNQVAVILYNVLAGEESPFLKNTRRGERTIRRQRKLSGYNYLPDGTITDEAPAGGAVLEKALSSGETEIADQPAGGPASMAVPVKFRDRVVGVIHVQAAEGGRKWSEDEIIMVQSISERAAFALENARLFEETTRRAEQEETITRVTNQIGASSDFDRILQTTIQELGQALGASRTFIQLGAPAEDREEAR